jgi:hypothetical protein
MLVTAALLLPLSGCATGAKYTEVASTLPPLAPSQGRIYFYRPSALGTAVQPDIKLNGQKVGTAKPHGFYFVDRAPGNYEVTAATETEKKLTFTLEPSQERFVRLRIQMGVLVGRIVPELVDKADAERELGKLSFIPDPLK